MSKLRLLLLALLISNFAGAQVLDYENRIDVILGDGTHVTMLGREKGLGKKELTSEYFYLPVGLRLSKKVDGTTPEFLFLKYTTEQKVEAGGVQGALMHFLMEWGLTPAQEAEAQKKLEEKVKGGGFGAGTPKLLGAVSLRPDVEESFRIVSATLTDKTFTPNFVTTGRAPLMPGAKVAVAAKLEKNGAQLLAATFEKTRSITDVSVSLRFSYDVIMPAVEGEITVDWEKVDSLFSHFKRDYKHSDVDDGTMPKANSLHDDVIADSSKDETYRELRDTKAVIVNLGVQYRDASNPIVQKVIEAFMDYFLQSVAEKEFVKPDEGHAINEPDKKYQPSEDLYAYHVNATKLAVKRAKGTETFRLNLRLPIREDWTITENLASWYDGVKNNPKCVSSVNLNDPFFQHRDINFILDLDAKDIFEQEVNYVTVNVRKKRSTGNDFNDAITIDTKYLKEKGVAAQMTYARAEDKNSDLYEYKSQWSLRGGKIWPPDAQWTKGDWQGVTLYPPIYPRNIEFEADIDRLKELNISRATIQVRYKKFGKEYEDNISISPAKNEPLVSKMIYTDNDTRGYAYRLIFNHTSKGKLALDWEAKINDNYVYASIPKELSDENSDIFKKASEAGKAIVATTTDNQRTIDATGSVLDLFKDIFGSPKK